MPIFELIAKSVDLTVAHSGSKPVDGGNFAQLLLKEKFFGPFSIHPNLIRIANRYDVVVSMFYLQKVSLINLAFVRKRNYKLIFWGIGLRASQKNKFDSFSILNYFRYAIAKRADAMIFYSQYAKEKYKNLGFNGNKLFVMNNTVVVNEPTNKALVRDRVLFVGTLNYSKRILELLKAFNMYKRSEGEAGYLILDIVGAGQSYNEVVNFVHTSGLSDSVKIHGAVYDEKILQGFYDRALISISPGQAGLSVLKSFGYGVPFATVKDAITGGERLNISNGSNGVLLPGLNLEVELFDLLVDVSRDSHKYLVMGNNAREYYLNRASPTIMAQGFIDAVQYVNNTK